MKKSFWLASYPKSGNTWLRILLANLARDGDAPVDINAIDSSDGIASARRPFDNHLLISSALLSHDAVDLLRPALHTHLATTSASHMSPKDMPVRFVKTHDGYTLNGQGEPVLGGVHAAAGALLIVRDPRDVAVSFAHHFRRSIDEAITEMGNGDHCFAAMPRSQSMQLRQRLLGWSGFAASWLDQRDMPVHLIRYEALHTAPHATIAAALAFVGWQVSADTIDRAIDAAMIDKLQRQEAEHGFGESGLRQHHFFRKGMAGGWRDDLNPAQIAKIEQDHWPMMQKLGYSIINLPEAAESAG